MDGFTELFGHSPLVWWILGAEAAFWLLLFGGLAVRYLLRARRLSSALLFCVPLVDVVLIALTAIDLSTGVEPNFSHVLAALYLGVTVAFGHAIIRRVDGWFSWRFAGGQRPAPVPKRGPEHVRRMWVEWFRVAAAWAVSSAGIVVLTVVSGTAPPASFEALWETPLWSVIARFTALVGIWLLAGPLYAVVFQNGPIEPSEDEPGIPPEYHGTPIRRPERRDTRP